MRTKTFFSSTKALTVGLFAFTVSALHAQVGINNTGATPNASAILDLQTGNAGVNKGFLPQAVALTATNSAAPITTPATGLIVYNTATAGSSPNNVVPGYYYWNGSEWLGMGAPTMGSGTAGYVAVWTPNNNTLGIGSIQDDGTEIGVGVAPTGGFGVYSYGSSTGGFFYSSADAQAWIGDGADNLAVSGYDNAETEYGSLAYGDGPVTGVYGQSSNTTGFGVYGYNDYLTGGDGIGVMGQGAGASGTVLGFNSFLDPAIYGDGLYMGVAGYAEGQTSTDAVFPVTAYNNDGGHYAYLAYFDGTTDYKCYGSGTVSTIVKDNNNVDRVMNCPEAPEILFEDYGTGSLSNGKVHIDLDLTFAKNVTINEKHALRVMITLNDECNGVFVTNRTSTGFDVVELNHGTSDASFTYEVIANRADSYDANGKLLSKNADNRFKVGISSVNATKPGYKVNHKAPNPPRITNNGLNHTNTQNSK